MPKTNLLTGVTNQHESAVAWNRRTGQAYTNAIVWQDTRTRAICNQLATEAGSDRFRDRAGRPPATDFYGPKIGSHNDRPCGSLYRR